MSWNVLTIRNEDEWLAGEVGGEGKQHGHGACISLSDPNIAYIAHDIGAIWRCTNLLSATPKWEKRLCRGFHALYSYSVACDPVNPDILILLGTRGFQTTADTDGIYVSTDGGDSFIGAEIGPRVDAKNGIGATLTSREHCENIKKVGSTWYVFVEEGEGAVTGVDSLTGVWTAEDSDLTNWTRVASVSGLRNISNIVKTPASDGFFVSTSVGIRKFTFANISTNPWSTPTQSGGQYCRWITQDPNNPNRYWATRATGYPNGSTGETGGTLYRSTDGGVTWTTLITQSQLGTIHAVHAQNNSGTTRLFIVSNDRPSTTATRQMKYTDDLASTTPTWTDVTVAAQTGVAASGTWDTIISGGFALSNTPCGVVFHPTNPVGFAYASARIFKTDNGTAWKWAATQFTGYVSTAYGGRGIHFDPADPDFMALFLTDTGYVDSINDCRFWTEYGKVPDTYGNPNMFIGHYDGAGIIVTGSGGPGQSGVYRNPGHPLTATGWVDITPGPADVSKPGAVGTARAYYVLAKHINVGPIETGQRRYILGSYRTISGIALGSITSASWQTMSIAGKGAEVIDINENGVLWAFKNVDDAFAAPPPNKGRGVWRSMDDGTNWNINNPMILPIASLVRGKPVIACHPTDNNVFYALCNRAGHVAGQIPDIARFTFAAGVTAVQGTHFTPLGLIQQIEANTGVLPWNQIAYLAIDPVNPEIMYVGTDGQQTDCLWMTTNLSSPTPTWVNISADFPPGSLRAMKIHPRTGDLIVSSMLGNFIRSPNVPRPGELSLNLINDAGQYITASYDAVVESFLVSVNASASVDPDGTIVSYAWDWGDLSPAGAGMITTHTYAAAGTYTVTLVVTDNAGATGTISKTVTVA